MNSKDIARIAGVSRSTVSRVINNYPNVPPETKEKVLKLSGNIIMFLTLQQGCSEEKVQKLLDW